MNKKQKIGLFLAYTVGIVLTPVYFCIHMVIQPLRGVYLALMGTLTYANDVVFMYKERVWWNNLTSEEKKEHMKKSLGITDELLADLMNRTRDKDEK